MLEEVSASNIDFRYILKFYIWVRIIDILFFSPNGNMDINNLDSKRPTVKLSTTSSMRTREHNIPILIKFMKPVFGFNSSSLSLSGGRLQRQAILPFQPSYK